MRTVRTDMNRSHSCPACHGDRIVHGDFVGNDPDDHFDRRFFPAGLDYIVAKPSVRLESREGFRACLSCGCVWNFVEPQALQALLLQRGLAPGEVPKPVSRIAHQARWLAFLAVAAVAVVWVWRMFGAGS